MVVDKLAQKLEITEWESSKNGKAEYAWGEIGQERIEFLKPQTFMNDSGFSVRYARKKHQNLKISDIYVIHDDLDIKLGEYKIQLGKGPKDHRGLSSIDQALGSSNYWHVRVGVENRPERTGEPSFAKAVEGKQYVLQDLTKDEKNTTDSVIQKIVKALEQLWKKKA